VLDVESLRGCRGSGGTWSGPPYHGGLRGPVSVACGVEFRILGPLEVLADGRPLPIAGEKQRALLALLLLHANEVVSSDRLLDELWGERPPAAGRTALRVRVSQLRKALGQKEMLVTRAPGYLLRAEPGQLDLHRFERLVAEAQEHEPALAAEKLRQALALWRGMPLAEFAHEPFAPAAIARLEEMRLAALERRVEADLALGRHLELVGELRELTDRLPLREGLRRHLMLALYRGGRQAEALEVYRAGRQTLVEELGIEPSRTLQELQHAILGHDPALDAPLGARLPQPRPDRAILVVGAEAAQLDPALELAEILAGHGPREVIAAQIVERPYDLAAAAHALNRRRESLLERRVPVRTAAFTSNDVADDILRVAVEQPVDLLLLTVDEASLDAGFSHHLRRVLERSPCDIGLVVAGRSPAVPPDRPVVAPFGGLEHDWAAVELAAWAAATLRTSVRLVGASANAALGRRDASRLLAAAALAIQRAFGVAAEPVLVRPDPTAVASAAEKAALLVLGLSRRWPDESIGPVRRLIISAARSPAVLVKAGLRPGGLTPRESMTRFTWSLAGSAR
jgi:DNA-binding SARP family transcriptional activator